MGQSDPSSTDHARNERIRQSCIVALKHRALCAKTGDRLVVGRNEFEIHGCFVFPEPLIDGISQAIVNFLSLLQFSGYPALLSDRCLGIGAYVLPFFAGLETRALHRRATRTLLSGREALLCIGMNRDTRHGRDPPRHSSPTMLTERTLTAE